MRKIGTPGLQHPNEMQDYNALRSNVSLLEREREGVGGL